MHKSKENTFDTQFDFLVQTTKSEIKNSWENSVQEFFLLSRKQWVFLSGHFIALLYNFFLTSISQAHFHVSHIHVKKCYVPNSMRKLLKVWVRQKVQTTSLLFISFRCENFPKLVSQEIPSKKSSLLFTLRRARKILFLTNMRPAKSHESTQSLVINLIIDKKTVENTKMHVSVSLNCRSIFI